MSSRRRLALTLPFLVGLVILGACSNNDDNRPPVSTGGITTPGVGGTTEGGTETDSSSLFDSGLDSADGAICTALTLMGNVVDGNFLTGDPPADTGGVITNGTYTLTDYETFVGDSSTSVGPTGISKKATIRITGGVLFEQIVGTTSQTMPEVDTTLAGSFSAAAPTFSIVPTCNEIGLSTAFGYTSTDTTLRLTDPMTKEQFTYTIM